MYVLYKDTWVDFDICQSEAIGVSENIEILRNEVKRLNSIRKNSDFKNGEWSVKYRVDNKKIKVY